MDQLTCASETYYGGVDLADAIVPPPHPTLICPPPEPFHCLHSIPLGFPALVGLLMSANMHRKASHWCLRYCKVFYSFHTVLDSNRIGPKSYNLKFTYWGVNPIKHGYDCIPQTV